jgi:hypothetical protein
MLMAISHSPAPAAMPGSDTAAKAAPAPVMSMGDFNMVMAQSLWDATMAYSIMEYLGKNKGKKVMQVNGRFHSDEGFAAVAQLKKYRPKSKILVISSASDESFPNIDWSKYVSQGDYIVITDPSVPRTFKEQQLTNRIPISSLRDVKFVTPIWPLRDTEFVIPDFSRLALPNFTTNINLTCQRKNQNRQKSKQSKTRLALRNFSIR